MTEFYVNAEIYHQWMKSPGWYNLVNRLKRERGNKCARCGAVGEVQGHHTSYLWLMTPHEDKTVELLCRNCHELIHRR